jgi:SAM-dependent methyltransferase
MNDKSDGWLESAEAWIASVGERGDWSREFVLDAVMLSRIDGRAFRRALDVGCGEGRFCRILRDRGINAIGVDPTEPMIMEARRRDPHGRYIVAGGEQLDFADNQFDLVVCYLALIDIADFRRSIREMARVLAPGGSLLIANLTGYFTAGEAQGWVRDEQGRALHYPVDRYLEEFPQRVHWEDISVDNWHRPLAAYMSAFLAQGLALRFFDEPPPHGGDPKQAALYRRAPWFVVMEWQKPDGGPAAGAR